MVSGNSNTFKYKLEGFDKDWNEARGHEATYTNLDKGRYTFLLKAANNDGIWCDTTKRLEITVRPIWYKSTIAQFLFFALIAGATVTFVIWLLKKKKKTKSRK